MFLGQIFLQQTRFITKIIYHFPLILGKILLLYFYQNSFSSFFFLLFPSQLNQINCRLIVKLPILGWVGLSKKSCVLGKLLHLRHILDIIFHFIRNTPDNPKVGRVKIILGPITFSESISFQLDQVSDNTQKTKSLI